MNAPASAAQALPTASADYPHAAIEARAQAAWARARAFATPPPVDAREPAYVLAGNSAPAQEPQIGHIRGYVIADAYARFLRARGRAVLFALGFDASLRDQLRALGCSMDWERTVVCSGPQQCGWTQPLLSALQEQGLIYPHEDRAGERGAVERGAGKRGAGEEDAGERDAGEGRTGDWRLRVTAYVRECERDLDALTGWDDLALAAQREALGRVDGVELDASTFDGTLLTVFTPYPDAISKAAFVAVASDHPHAERWRTGAFATVPGVAGMLPIVVSEEVGARFGTTAVLGIPAKDLADAAIAKQLPELAGTTWKAAKTSATPRPAARWRVHDVAISSQSGLWSWLALCVPPAERGEEAPADPEYMRWLPAAQIVRGADAGEQTLRERVLAKALHDAGQLAGLPSGEPFANALTCGAIRLDNAPNARLGDLSRLDALLAAVGADAVRLALLHAASPARPFTWNDQPLRHCNNFLQSLHGYAAERLREWSPRAGGAVGIDPSDRLRRRLARWCGVACEKVTDSLGQLAMQRAAHNAMLLLTRIEDFERRALALRGGALEPADREAVVAALALLTQLLAPLAPHITEELWSLAGNDSLVSNAQWPAPGGPADGGTHRATGVSASAQLTPTGTARSRSTAASAASRAS